VAENGLFARIVAWFAGLFGATAEAPDTQQEFVRFFGEPDGGTPGVGGGAR
jgi:hypothetical protein